MGGTFFLKKGFYLVTTFFEQCMGGCSTGGDKWPDHAKGAKGQGKFHKCIFHSEHCKSETFSQLW